MKTAMQELIEFIDDNFTVSNSPQISSIYYKAQELLEKEKEQIVNDFENGYKACDLDEALEINKTMFSGERYYEQTYKP
jgi:hypothetical protein